MKFINKTDIIYDGSSPIKVGNYKGTVHFKYKKHYYLTEGSKKVSVECCEVLPDSIEVEYFAELREKKYIRIPLVEFEGRQPAFLNQIIATYNCHGFAITNGKYFIDNNDATKIFDDEYETCDVKDCELVIFIDDNTKSAEHSGKFNQLQSTISDKQGVRPLVCSNTIVNIKKEDEYKNTQEQYLKKKT